MRENTVVLTLKQIADWQLSSRDKIAKGACWAEMPSFQRGLVWKPAQIEVLWDSLMRGIPIGALSLLPIEGNERFQKKKVDMNLSEAYWVVDGQQRSNAIALGFKPFPDKNESILWLDMLPDRSKRTRRKFFFYVTTPGRPWGYRVTSGNDERVVENVSTDEYRRILREELKWDKGMGSKPPTYMLWPVKAKLPVPFSKLREYFMPNGKLRESFAPNGFEDLFASIIAENAEWARHFQRCWSSYQGDDVCRARINEELHLVRGGLSRVQEAKTIGLIAYGGLSGDENENQEADENSNLAVYFSRLNQGGTPPGREDLDYSILKSVVPKLSVIDEFAKGLMHPSRLANIAMLTHLSSEKWKETLNRSDIYKLQFDEVFSEFIGDCAESRFRSVVNVVIKWLKYDSDNEFGLPMVICSSIAKDAPRLFRLLLLLALMHSDTSHHIDRKLLISFVTIVNWFAKDENLDYQLLYEQLQSKSSVENFPAVLFGWIGNQIEHEKIVMPPRLRDFAEILKASSQKDLALIRKSWNPIGYSDGLNQLWGWTSLFGRGFLLYACRGYLAKEFADYDPASAVWNEDDRPWDYDHIIPQKWLQQGRGNPHGRYHDIVEKLLNSIGNIAPVPFSINRSKHDAPPCDYLGEDNKRVFVDFRGLDEVRPHFVDARPKRKLEEDKDAACNLVFMTALRWIALYKEWLRLPIFELLKKTVNGRRVENIKTIKRHFASRGMPARVVYLWSDGRQYDVEDDVWNLSRPWLACGVNAKFRRATGKDALCFMCVCMQSIEKREWFEIGLRRPPESNNPFDEHNEWWIDEGDLFKETDSFDEALEHLKLLLGRSDIRFE